MTMTKKLTLADIAGGTKPKPQAPKAQEPINGVVPAPSVVEPPEDLPQPAALPLPGDPDPADEAKAKLALLPRDVLERLKKALEHGGLTPEYFERPRDHKIIGHYHVPGRTLRGETSAELTQEHCRELGLRFPRLADLCLVHY